MKIEPKYTEKKFDKITKLELYNLWFREALTDKQIATLYRTTKDVVKEKRKKYNMTIFKCAILFLIGGEQYKRKLK